MLERPAEQVRGLIDILEVGEILDDAARGGDHSGQIIRTQLELRDPEQRVRCVRRVVGVSSDEAPELRESDPAVHPLPATRGAERSVVARRDRAAGATEALCAERLERRSVAVRACGEREELLLELAQPSARQIIRGRARTRRLGHLEEGELLRRRRRTEERAARAEQDPPKPHHRRRHKVPTRLDARPSRVGSAPSVCGCSASPPPFSAMISGASFLNDSRNIPDVDQNGLAGIAASSAPAVGMAPGGTRMTRSVGG